MGRGARVLDLGAGEGELARRLETEGHRVLALDAAGTPGGIVARFERLPVADGAADAAAFVASLHHAANVDAALAEARRALRTGGVLVIALSPVHEGEREAERGARGARRLARRAVGDGALATGYRHLVRPRLASALAAAGFDDVTWAAAPLSVTARVWRLARNVASRGAHADFPLIVARAT